MARKSHARELIACDRLHAGVPDTHAFLVLAATKYDASGATDTEERVRRLGSFGLLERWGEFADAPWIRPLLDIDEVERQRTSLDRRVRDGRVCAFKAIDAFDWNWRRAIVPSRAVLFCTASDMLANLAAQDGSSSLARRLRRLTSPRILCIDELKYRSRCARYAGRPVAITTNNAFNDRKEAFPDATRTVTLVDRRVRRSEIIEIDGESYRLREAKERAAARASSRKARRQVK